MLTYQVDDFKSFSQKFYEECLSRIDFFSVQCTCRHKGCLKRHGFYKRNVKTDNGIVTLKILRVRCSECGKTHAVLLSSMVPFSQISVPDQFDIILGDDQRVMDNNPDINESSCSHIRKSYRSFFSEFLKGENVPLSDIRQIISVCLSKLRRQFMQMKCSMKLRSMQIILLENILISQNHITSVNH